MNRLLTLTPLQFLRIDGLGAMLSTFLLGYVLVELKKQIGMPVDILHILAGVAFLFMIYSFFSYLSKPKKDWLYLRIIALLNIGYCLATLCLIILFYDVLTLIGLIYFVCEILIIFGLAVLELKVAAASKD